MMWSLQLLRSWVPIVGLSSALQLRRLILHEAAGAPPREFEIKLRSPRGSIIRLRVPGTDAFTFRDVFENGIYDEAVRRAGPCARIVDIGANIGCATLRFAALQPRARIVSVEPLPGNFAILESNTRRLVEAGGVQLINAAVWSHETEVTVANPENRFSTQVEMRASAPGDRGPRIAGLPISAILDRAGFDRADLVKIDVEGAEVFIFRSDTGWLDRVNSIAIEFHRDSRAESGFDEVVIKAGFSVHDLGQGTIFASRS